MIVVHGGTYLAYLDQKSVITVRVLPFFTPAIKCLI